jgi:hypothetical protein
MARKLDVGAVLRAALRTYRDQAGLLLPAALLLFIPVAVVDGVGQAQGYASLALAVVFVVINGVAIYWFQGMVAEAIRDLRDGLREVGLGGLFASVRPVLLPLTIVGVLASIGIVIGLVLLVMPALVLATWWALVAPVVVVERPGVAAAFGRRRSLVRGNGWRVFGIVFAYGVVSLALYFAVAFVSSSPIVFALGRLMTAVLVEPLYAVAVATIFFELKRGGEG